MSEIGTNDFESLASVFPAELDEILRRHGVITQRPNAKLKTCEQFMRMLLLHVGCDLPLRQTAAILKEANIVDISPMRIHKNLAKAPDALAELVSLMVSGPIDGGERWGGYDVTLVDGSVVVSPGPTNPGGRLHIKQRLSSLEIVEARVSATYEMGETLRNFTFAPDELVVGDRAYSTPVGIASVVQYDADVLVRVNRGTLPLYDSTETRIDLERWVGTACRGTRVTSRSAVILTADGERIPGRLIARRLPPNERGKARARLAREHGGSVSEKDLAWAEYWVLFTTASSRRLSDAQILSLYRARWQVELQFKRWKSICNFDTLKNWRPDTVVAWLTAKLFLALCLEKLADASFSPRSRARTRLPHAA